jgi:hypothetical protein
MVEDVDPELLARISRGVKVRGTTLVDARAVEVAPERRNTRGWPAFIVGARLSGPEFEDDSVGTWAIGHDGGTVFALNDDARAFTFWAEPARPGTFVDGLRSVVADYPEAREAEDAVRSS